MSKREEYDSSDTAVVETLRSASNKPVEAAPAKKHEEEKVSLFWRLFGGTILSVVALAGITLYNTMNNSISELRAEVVRLNEVKVDAAKKEDVVALRTRADDNRREIDSMKERLSKYRTELDAAKKEQGAATDAAKKEQGAAVEAVRKDLLALEKDLQKALAEAREKIARIEGQQTPMKPTADK